MPRLGRPCVARSSGLRSRPRDGNRSRAIGRSRRRATPEKRNDLHDYTATVRGHTFYGLPAFTSYVSCGGGRSRSSKPEWAESSARQKRARGTGPNESSPLPLRFAGNGRSRCLATEGGSLG